MKLTEYPLRDQTIQKTQMYAVRSRAPCSTQSRSRQVHMRHGEITNPAAAVPGGRSKRPAAGSRSRLPHALAIALTTQGSQMSWRDAADQLAG